jgi:hypothetical protein
LEAAKRRADEAEAQAKANLKEMAMKATKQEEAASTTTSQLYVYTRVRPSHYLRVACKQINKILREQQHHQQHSQQLVIFEMLIPMA